MSKTQGAQICVVTLFDADGTECGKAYATVSGEVYLEWGYGDTLQKLAFTPEDIPAVAQALSIVTPAAQENGED